MSPKLMDTALWQAVNERILRGDSSGGAEMLANRLRERKPERFGTLADASFRNDPAAILEAINSFLEVCSREFEVKAVYLEMNGFDLNPDRWYFDRFGYDQYLADPGDLDWLSRWRSQSALEVDLQGLEAVQDDFAWYQTNRIYEDPSFDAVYELALLLVMTRFVQLVEAALASGPLAKRVPVLATAHEFDIVGRFEP